jgi:hypothetical protein
VRESTCPPGLHTMAYLFMIRLFGDPQGCLSVVFVLSAVLHTLGYSAGAERFPACADVACLGLCFPACAGLSCLSCITLHVLSLGASAERFCLC